LQELAYGGLPDGVRKYLADCGAKHSKITITNKGRGNEVHLMPGTQLLREWDDREDLGQRRHQVDGGQEPVPH